MLRQAKIKKAFKARSAIDECNIKNLNLGDDYSKLGPMQHHTEKQKLAIILAKK